MHVVFFNRSFHPDTAATGQLLTELCEDLVKDYACRVSVVAGVPLLSASDNGTKRGNGYIFHRENHEGIDILDRKSTRLNSSHSRASRMPSSA